MEIITNILDDFTDLEGREIIQLLCDEYESDPDNYKEIFRNSLLSKYVSEKTLNIIDFKFKLKENIKKINDVIDSRLVEHPNENLYNGYSYFRSLVILNKEYFEFNIKKYFMFTSLFVGSKEGLLSKKYGETWKIYCEIHGKEKAIKDLYDI